MDTPVLDFSCTSVVSLSKEKILERVSEENIWSFYGVPVTTKIFCSPIRKEKHPSCGLFRTNTGALLMKDFATGWTGDCFRYVGEMFQVSYYSALRIIATDFNIIPPSKKYTPNKAILQYNGVKITEHDAARIRVEIRDFQDYELKWWSGFGISKETLQYYNVYSCKNIWLNDNLFHLETDHQYIFGYYGGKDKNGIEYWRIYHPMKHKYRFITNWPAKKLQGAQQLSKNGGDLLIITKALKDVMLLHELGIQAIAPNSEHLFVSDAILTKLKNKYKRIIVWYDNDEAGLINLEKIKSTHPNIEIFSIPTEYDAKDVSDLYKKIGKKRTIEFLKKCLEIDVTLKEEDLNMKEK